MYAIVTPPGTMSSKGSAVGGYNAFTYYRDGLDDLDDEVYLWIGGGNAPQNFNIDTYTTILSHELCEAISDPQTITGTNDIHHNGFRVDPGASFPNPLPTQARFLIMRRKNTGIGLTESISTVFQSMAFRSSRTGPTTTRRSSCQTVTSSGSP